MNFAIILFIDIAAFFILKTKGR